MPRLIILGAGSPEPTPERWGTGFLFELNNEWFMIDCGPGSTYKMLTMGISPTQINHLFFTHYHSDHVSDYPCFLMTRFERALGVEKDLTVYGPPPLKAMTDGLWSQAHGVFWLDVIARTQHPMSIEVFQRRGGQPPRPEPVVHVNEFHAGKVADQPQWQCCAYEVDHAQPYLECFGFRFETEHGVIAFSGDAEPTEVILELAHGADIFIMATMGPETIRGEAQMARLAEAAGVKRLVVTHLAPSLTASDEVIEAALNDIRRVFKGEIYWGQDMMEIEW